MDYTYTGAPDECNIHWPKKLNSDGLCHVEGCPNALTSEEAEQAYRLESKTIRIIRTSISSPVIDKLEERHLRSFCSDGDCWCHDDSYWEQKLGADY